MRLIIKKIAIIYTHQRQSFFIMNFVSGYNLRKFFFSEPNTTEKINK